MDAFALEQDFSLVDFLQPVYAADKRAFTGAARTADNHDFPAFHLIIYIFQNVEIAEPFVDIAHFNQGHGEKFL
jgi:hypothetical protein